MSYINKEELVNALERIDIPSPEAIAIAAATAAFFIQFNMGL